MKLIKFIKNILPSKKPRTPNEFVSKFIKDCKKERCQLELSHNKELILQVDSLLHVPSWFKITKQSRSKFENGFVLYLVRAKEDYKNSFISSQYELYKNDQFIKLEDKLDDVPVITIAKFITKPKEPIDLAKEMRDFIDTFWKFKEDNPPILFNIRYLKGIAG